MPTPRPSRDTGDLLRGSADLVVLSVLADESMYGYAISKRVEGQSDGRIRLTPGVVYPLLHQLEADGLLLSVWDDGDGRRRKWYRLSAKGKRRLAKRAAAHRAYAAIIDSFLPAAREEGGA